MEDLRDLGNTILVVEHDPDVIRAADYLLDLGPGAGELGGQSACSRNCRRGDAPNPAVASQESTSPAA